MCLPLDLYLVGLWVKLTPALAKHRTNLDLDPVPVENRKWGLVALISYWISDAFNAATWQFAASIIAVGLTWRESLGIVATSFFMISIVVR